MKPKETKKKAVKPKQKLYQGEIQKSEGKMDRVQITVPYCFMPLDGQWQVVLGGSIVDVPNADALKGAGVKISETATSTGSVPTSVRSVRTR